MSALRAVIIDDELSCRNLLMRFLDHPELNVRVVGEAESIKDGVFLIKEQQPDLVFLDIHLSDGTGFQLLEALDRITFRIIFITAHDQYALQAIRFSALDYLLKPLDPEQLRLAVLKLQTNQGGNTGESVSVLIDNKTSFEKIALPTSDGLKLVRIKNIIRCQSDNNYTFIFLKDGSKFLVTRTLKEYEELLTPMNFFRVHQSHLINMDFVDRYIKGEGGTVVMEDSSEIEVSRRKKEQFMTLLKKV